MTTTGDKVPPTVWLSVSVARFSSVGMTDFVLGDVCGGPLAWTRRPLAKFVELAHRASCRVAET